MPTLNWIGKEAVVNHHLQVPFHLLKDVPELACGNPGEGNLIVQGDNLVALKALLPYYAGQVKCIYIDPPYNTGNESWDYNDNVNSPVIREWLGKVVGKEGETLDRHDRWLCMMYPRLVLLKQFLRQDGVILMSLDTNEHRYAELLFDEIFGIQNRVETFVWKKSYGGGAKSKQVVNLHEYILCFAKSRDCLGEIVLPPDENTRRYYKFSDHNHETRGPYRLQPLATNSMDARPNLRYSILFEGHEIWPEKQWQWSRERSLAALENNELVIKQVKGKWSVNYKQYLKDGDGEERGAKLYSIIEGVYTQHGTNEVKELFGDGKAFSFPKPPELVQKLVQAFSDKDSLILDSFAGSGTTGHAVLKQNADDGGNRRFILVEMDDQIARNVTTERVRRVAEGYTNAKGEHVEGIGGGFRYCELGEPLFDAHGKIRDSVRFAELARHVYFTETGEPLPRERVSKSALLGECRGVGIYLLYNGILGDKSANGGNVLTRAVLAQLPPFDGPKVIYCAGCLLGRDRLRAENIIVRQTPYEIKVS
ncbi:MAG: site-specific DNA-methyltransferase, partial [Sideroxyarcus sp.]|nr:site-specific DNA-methyltransferase [Sideroxyarcus sp.]